MSLYGEQEPINVLLFHAGCFGVYIREYPPGAPNLPACLEDCIKQYRLFNDGPIYFLTDAQNFVNLAKYDQLIPVAIEDYGSDKIARLNALCECGPRDFWTIASTRLIYMENFLAAHDLRHVYHFENDVLVYFPIADHHHVFKRLYPSLAVTPVGPTYCATAVMYIDNARALAGMTSFFIETLEQLGLEGTKKRYGLPMISEMGLMRAYGMEKGERLGFLPILPFGESSQHYEDFGAIFDPASWGQFVGGSRHEGPGAKLADHYIGDLLREHPQYAVGWRAEDGLRIPYFVYDDNWVRINNLHIHSKNLHLYTSKGMPC